MENNGKDEGLSSQPFLVRLFIILIFGSLVGRTSSSGRQSEEAAVSVASDAAEAISVSAASEKSEGSFTAEPVVSAETAVLIDAASGKVLYDKREERTHVSRQHDEDHDGADRAGNHGIRKSTLRYRRMRCVRKDLRFTSRPMRKSE